MFDLTLADHLRQFAGGVAAHAIHLEQAVLCSGVALREKQIVKAASRDGGEPAPITRYCDGIRKPGNLHCAVQLRQR